MENGYAPVFRLPMGDKPLWLQCCPTWLLRQPESADILEFSFYAETGNLPAIWNSGNPVLSILKNGFKCFDAANKTAVQEKIDEDK